ncbi:hypothetical protein [Weissella confusa]|uniref:hypothetical protein n=1 Tax=Weissella confusa TaxID=1583 RepID=UPI0010809AA4|nr:hypothetical protein [Weissella confusa]MBJ7654359.1 hypothetical protein [Weissella confusa]
MQGAGDPSYYDRVEKFKQSLPWLIICERTVLFCNFGGFDMGYAVVENHYGDNYVARVDSEQDIEDIMQTCEI